MPVLLLLLVLVAVLLAAATCRAGTPPAEVQAAHVADRLSFGPFPGEIDRIKAMGVQAYIEEQLNPGALPLPESLTARLAALTTSSMDTVTLFRAYGPKAPGGPRSNPTMDEIQSAKEKAQIIQAEAAEAKLWRAILSPRQLEEVLVDFWYNHFNVPADKGLAHLWVGSYEREAIRPYVLGNFKDMLLAVTRHPAMLIYLENWQSASAGSQIGKNLQRPLVELHAREVMTSHTMGSNLRAKAQDMANLAQMLAGWSIGSPHGPGDVNGFVFDERRHESKDRDFMGTSIKGGGVQEGIEALNVLAASPDTARNISAKLAAAFVSEDPPKELVESLARTFTQSGGNLKAVMRELLASQEFMDPKYIGAKLKSPLRFVVAIARACGRPIQETRSLAENLEWLGQPLYNAPGVSGFKDDRAAWLAADLFLKRLNMASLAGRGALPCWQPGSYAPVEKLDPDSLAKAMGLTVLPLTKQGMDKVPPEYKAGVLLGSPEAQQY